MALIVVTDATFEAEVLRSELPVLIELHADWCAPCRQLAPIVEEVANELEGKLKVAKIDIDRNPVITQSFRVQSVPMLLLLHQGRLAGHQMGVVDKQTILRMVEPVLPADAAELSVAELAPLVAQGRALAVDIRDSTSFGRYRIPGAINIPTEQALERAAEFRPVDGRFRVLYSRSTDDAKALAEQLRDKGLEVGFLKGGFLHWEAEGLDVERGGT